MSTKETKGGKSTASRRLDVQIVHGLCHDCPNYEELYEAEMAADAIEAAIEDAIEHARDTGHENVDHELLTDPDLNICQDCDDPVQASLDAGPGEETKQLCGCTQVAGQ